MRTLIGKSVLVKTRVAVVGVSDRRKRWWKRWVEEMDGGDVWKRWMEDNCTKSTGLRSICKRFELNWLHTCAVKKTACSVLETAVWFRRTVCTGWRSGLHC